eukprot:6184420-Pleurochrysis_carterae.AAC.1
MLAQDSYVFPHVMHVGRRKTYTHVWSVRAWSARGGLSACVRAGLQVTSTCRDVCMSSFAARARDTWLHNRCVYSEYNMRRLAAPRNSPCRMCHCLRYGAAPSSGPPPFSAESFPNHHLSCCLRHSSAAVSQINTLDAADVRRPAMICALAAATSSPFVAQCPLPAWTTIDICFKRTLIVVSIAVGTAL